MQPAHDQSAGRRLEEVARALRMGVAVTPREGTARNQKHQERVGVWGRVRENALWIDARCLRDEDVAEAAQVITHVLKGA